jgi:hypothetical protein
LTLRDVAAAGGGPHFTVIGRIENGMKPKRDHIEKIARGLHVRPENLERAIRLSSIEERANTPVSDEW